MVQGVAFVSIPPLVLTGDGSRGRLPAVRILHADKASQHPLGASMFRCLILVSLVLASGCASSTSSSGTTCTTPAGTYAIEFVPVNGDCPADFNTAFAAAAKSDSTKISEDCYTKTMSSALTVTAGGQDCQVAVSGSAAGATSGYTGTASIAVTCPDGSKCQEAFTLAYTKK